MRRDVVPPEGTELAGYAELLVEIKDRVRHAQVTAVRRVNTELVEMYLAIGCLILDRQSDEGWGARVIGQRAAEVFGDEMVQQPVGQLPWGHLTVLLVRVPEPEVRLWYAAKAGQHGWSRNVLITHIVASLHTRSNDSPTPALTPTAPLDSDLVRGLVKDPYRLDFLSLDAGHTERAARGRDRHQVDWLPR